MAYGRCDQFSLCELWQLVYSLHIHTDFFEYQSLNFFRMHLSSTLVYMSLIDNWIMKNCALHCPTKNACLCCIAIGQLTQGCGLWNNYLQQIWNLSRLPSVESLKTMQTDFFLRTLQHDEIMNDDISHPKWKVYCLHIWKHCVNGHQAFLHKVVPFNFLWGKMQILRWPIRI